MKTMKKLVAFLLALVMVLALAACGSKDNTDKPADNQPAQSQNPNQPAENTPATPEGPTKSVLLLTTLPPM